MAAKNLFTAVFFDRDGVLNPDVPGTGVNSADKLCLFPKAADAVRLVNEAGWLAVLITNQPHIAKGLMSFEDLEAIHTKLQNLLAENGAKLDGIYFCPHHPDGGIEGEIPHLKTYCSCRKPEPGLIKKAISELPIQLEGSCMIGDSWRDMGIARAMGISAYGVKTGFGCQNCVGDYEPDRIFPDVFSAVLFALHGTEPESA
ncbi:MAG: HAD family hydrolase [Pseudomonadota bacterium]